MNNNKEYISITVAYLLVILYVIFGDNKVLTVFFIACLFAYHVMNFYQLKIRLSQDKETSVSKLLSRLDKSKREEEETYKRFISLSTNLGSGLLMIDEEGKVIVLTKL